MPMRALLPLLLMLGLAACGLKKDLYLPEPKGEPAATAPAADAEPEGDRPRP
jgi:predicted small lipoprotein YifL